MKTKRLLLLMIGLIALGLTIAFWAKLWWFVVPVVLLVIYSCRSYLSQYIAGIIMRFERPFTVGDYLFAETFGGEVTRHNLRVTRLRDWSGLEVVIPNSHLAKQNLSLLKSDPPSEGELDIPIYLSNQIGKEATYDLLQSVLRKQGLRAEIHFRGQTKRCRHLTLRFSHALSSSQVERLLKAVEDDVSVLVKPRDPSTF